MKGDHIFASAMRERENPPDLENPDEPPHLVPEGFCPYCGVELLLNDDYESYHPTPKVCNYANEIDEEANRNAWLKANNG